MMEKTRTHGLWGATAPAAPQTHPLREALHIDVAIVGAGYTGLSAALHLARLGLCAAVVEARQIGHGGAGRNVGLVNAGLWVMPDEVARSLGSPFGEQLLELLGDGPRAVFEIIDRYEIACEAERNGTLHCAVGESGLREIEERAAQWQRRGADVALLDAAETARRVGGGRYTGALLDRRAGTIQPLAYARGLAAAALAEGARLFTDSQVLSFEVDGDHRVVRTANGHIRARSVIVATDAYGTDCFRDVALSQVSLPYFNFATKPLGDNVRRSILPGLEGAWDTREVLSSFRLDRNGRLVFGSVGALRGTGATVHRAWARRAIAAIFPQIGEIDFEEEWYGTIGMTSDAMPRFFEIDPQVFGVCGYNGRGIAPGTVFGKLLADLVAGRIRQADMPLPTSTLDQARFRTAKALFYEFGSQAAHLVARR